MSDKGESEEKKLVESYDSGEWQSTDPSEKEFIKYREYASATLAKDKRINIRIASRVLEGLQIRALEEGIPYQTLVASILHKFVAGRLVEKVDDGKG